jgi:hypothetical protein
VSSCPLTCTDSDLTLAKNHYDTKGQWRGVYRMTPNRANKVGSNQCDVNYTYRAIIGTASGIDYRRFTYSDPTSCTKSVTVMGDYLSGTTAS